MAHPQQQAHAVSCFAPRTWRGRFVVDELGEPDPFLGAGRAAIAVVDDGAESGAAHCALKAEIVHAPVECLWPQRLSGIIRRTLSIEGILGMPISLWSLLSATSEVEAARDSPSKARGR